MEDVKWEEKDGGPGSPVIILSISLSKDGKMESKIRIEFV